MKAYWYPNAHTSGHGRSMVYDKSDDEPRCICDSCRSDGHARGLIVFMDEVGPYSRCDICGKRNNERS